MKRISVALATYNGGRFLHEQLQSLSQQSLSPHELVVSDDKSDDDTLSIVRSFAEKAPFPVVVIEGEGRLGYRLNFRRAANRCSGELIAFCDQDDIWKDNKLRIMARCFDDPTVQLAYHNATVFNEILTRPLHDAAEELSDLGQHPLPPFKFSNGLLQIFRADLRRYDYLWDKSVDHNEGNVILAHDQWYFFLALLLGRVEFVNQLLLMYRQHGGNTYGAKVKETMRERLFKRLIHFGESDAWAARGAKSRARIAAEIASIEGFRDAQEIVDEYRALAERMERRAKTYSLPGIVGRASTAARSVACGDYQGGPWRFQRASIVRDLWSGVLMAKRKDPTRA